MTIAAVIEKINQAEEILSSSISDETKFDVIFGMNIWQSIREEGYHFEWCDPDTTYEEDVTAYVKALVQWRDNQTGQNQYNEFKEITAHKNVRDGNDCTIYTYLIKIEEADMIVKIQYCSSGGWGNNDLFITTHKSDEFRV